MFKFNHTLIVKIHLENLLCLVIIILSKAMVQIAVTEPRQYTQLQKMCNR
ncbi:hypothetical protein METHB2_200011 [Candidatus Methylobacter favarea]|uniref:Uncharacterized protein n=1 Tax=Candidatus Methylobacter favarea TaxID=2707345 RepID=A0A8S0WZQ4_9GAMM|nr:hypothetical protein METHB2_200011 [Candidatus Methylobacter favarea]